LTVEERNRHRAQRLVGVAILLVMIVLGWMLFSSSFDGDFLPELIEKLPENVDLGLDRVHYSQNENGIESWVLDADRAAYQREDEELALTGVELTFFNASSFGDVKLNAAGGILRQKQKLIDLKGDVRIVTATGEQFQSETLRYDYAKRLATTDDLISMRGRQLNLTGKGMDLDLGRGTLRVRENVHALLYERQIEGERQ
jgi:LPS export ABC transporter protein LptC